MDFLSPCVCLAGKKIDREERGAVRHTADRSTTPSAILHLNCLPPGGEGCVVCVVQERIDEADNILVAVAVSPSSRCRKDEKRERDMVDQRLSLSLLIDFYESEYFSPLSFCERKNMLGISIIHRFGSLSLALHVYESIIIRNSDGREKQIS